MSSFLEKSPSKSLVSFLAVPLASVVIIKDVIEEDEGGWVITQTPGDNDGGWTYGGMTAKKFQEYYPGTTARMIVEAVDAVESKEKLRQVVLAIYYQDFLVETMKQLNYNVVAERKYFSAIINVGAGGFRTILSNMKVRKTPFTTAWKDYYFDLTRSNPNKMQFLRGWINRVWRYVDAG